MVHLMIGVVVSGGLFALLMRFSVFVRAKSTDNHLNRR